MTIRLDFVRETEKARLYSDRNGDEFWIPRSVITSCLKFPPKNPDFDMPVHELVVEDWWWDKHLENEEKEEEYDQEFFDNQERHLE